MTGHQASRSATRIDLHLNLARQQRSLIRVPAPGTQFERYHTCSPSRALRIMPSSRPPQPQLTSTYTPAIGIIRHSAYSPLCRIRHNGETRLSGSGKGRRKRTRATGTSPAAYFTLRRRWTQQCAHRYPTPTNPPASANER